MRTQAEKGAAFRQLHERPGAFVIPNPWDVGTARLLAKSGFEALATTSAGFAFSEGRRDGKMGRDRVLAHCREMVAATDLPVSADLENCFGDDPQMVAETIRLAAATGLAGGSIEDSTGRAADPIYDHELAVDRVRAAAEAATSLAAPFILTARSENFLNGRPDLKDTIRRLQAFQEAGADVLYAPGLTKKDDIAAVVSSVDRPVNVLMGLPNMPLTVADLSAIGVKRISVGGALARAAFGAFLRAVAEIRDRGSFRFVDEAVSSREINGLFEV
jgi:2-methylisocitrate lyase-like PEP mutase family enzyme